MKNLMKAAVSKSVHIFVLCPKLSFNSLFVQTFAKFENPVCCSKSNCHVWSILTKCITGLGKETGGQ